MKPTKLGRELHCISSNDDIHPIHLLTNRYEILMTAWSPP